MGKPVLVVFLGAILAASLGPVACGGHSENSTCAAGRSISCVGPENCLGRQICKSDSSGYGDCTCDLDSGTSHGGASAGGASAGGSSAGGSSAGGAGNGGASSGGSVTVDSGPSFPNSGPTSGLFGASCNTNQDCRTPLSCVPSSSTAFSGEGPANGVCTLDCSNDPTTCGNLDPNTECVIVGAGTRALCLPGCALGDPGAFEDKCRSRADMSCNDDGSGTGFGYCFPTCGSDADCGSEHCDYGTGLCSPTKIGGDPVGTPCDPSGSTCAGYCITSGGGAECSGYCTLGTAGCGADTSKGPPYDTYCVFENSVPAGLDDSGSCAKLCDCDADCGDAREVCVPYAPGQTLTGRAGFCDSAIAADGGVATGMACDSRDH